MLTAALRDMLEDIENHPGLNPSGPSRALATKLRNRGLVETFVFSPDPAVSDEIRGFRTTQDGRKLLGRGLDQEMKAKIEAEILMMLHASRDCLRTKGIDTGAVSFHAMDGYYGEAFGVMRALRVLGYGDFGAVNIAGNLSSWFHDLEQCCLVEENFRGSNECDHCLERYGKDGAGRRRGR